MKKIVVYQAILVFGALLVLGLVLYLVLDNMNKSKSLKPKKSKIPILITSVPLSEYNQNMCQKCVGGNPSTQKNINALSHYYCSPSKDSDEWACTNSWLGCGRRANYVSDCKLTNTEMMT